LGGAPARWHVTVHHSIYPPRLPSQYPKNHPELWLAGPTPP